MLRHTYHQKALFCKPFWSGTSFVPSPFLVSTSWFLILTNVLQNDSVFPCSIACRGAAEMNEMSEYGTVQSAKMTQYSSTAEENVNE